MNTSSLKTFAQNARNKLRAQVAARLNYWVGAEGGTAPDTAAHRQFAPQIRELRVQMAREGRDGLVERVSYLWFNRLAALRFMDANDFHPFGVRVVSPAGENDILPALLQQSRAGAMPAEIRAKLANPQTFDDILAGRIPVAHPETELFGMLLLAACNYYHDIMPFLFEELGDATQLLLPEDLLSAQSILTDIRENLTADDCREVEVIGWLYQFYISEKKAEVDARKKAVPTEDIPAVTQLFTPHWIVRYLVENSLGRLWLLNRPHSRLREQMPYYIEGEPEADFLRITSPEEIKLLDPACGSAHMLTYAFDLLYLIYEEEGYDAKDIPSLILRHNLHGTEICERAAALAAFALCMKARAKDRRFFKRLTDGEDAPKPRIIELQDVRFEENEMRDYIHALGLGDLVNQPLLKLLHQFEEAKNFGSLIQPCLDERAIAFARRAIEVKDVGDQLFLRETHRKVLRALEQAESLIQRYHVVVANPPYMGSALMNGTLRQWSLTRFPRGQEDLFGCFIERCAELSLPLGFVAMIAQQSWMFIKGFESLRQWVVQQNEIVTFAHNGFGVFGADFGTASFCLRIGKRGDAARVYISLREGKTPADKESILLSGLNRYVTSQAKFQHIPTCIFAYWASKQLVSSFESGRRLEDIAPVRQGFQTGQNATFLRSWQEVSQVRSVYTATSKEEVFASSRKWVPYNKGGPFRKWFGNNDLVVAFDQKNYEILSRSGNCLPSRHLYFKEAVTWSAVTVGTFSSRFSPQGFTFSSGGACAFPNPGFSEIALGLLNSTVVASLLEFLGATINFNVGSLRQIPVVNLTHNFRDAVCNHVREAIALARADWDNFETSWDFHDQPLLRPGLKGATLDASWRNWEAQSTAAIRRMQELETENNRIFITAYGLEGELQPEVPEDQITLARSDQRKDIAAFLSYAVGCMMGRYSTDLPGLILANAGDTLENFRSKIQESRLSMDDLSFTPDDDAIIPVLDGEWFTDDIVGRFREFLRVTFGDASFTANLRFIEESLGKVDPKTGKIKATDLRSYFVRDFYKNHLSNERAYGYKKRPIYWMVSSPNGSFQALIYLHRYTRDTMNHVLDRYVRPFIDKLEQRQQACTVISSDAAAKPAARTAAQKELVQLAKMLKEIREWERDSLLPIAQQRIDLDLDDGVKVNYLKFKGVLVPIPGLEKKEE